MTDPSQTYQAYLLRLWRLNDTMPWRATLVQDEGGRQWHFADPESLNAHLLDMMRTPPTTQEPSYSGKEEAQKNHPTPPLT